VGNRIILNDTIAAVSTASGKGGIGIIRLSGPKALLIAQQITQLQLQARYAHFCNFESSGEKIDEGITLFFPQPNSFTGEDVVELQSHGSPIVLDLLLNETVRLGARMARPGEFSERAFLNNKIDLIQAEAIADIIDSQSVSAAQSALRSLNGDFSKKINQLLKLLTELRIYIEASIDFPDEDVDFLADKFIAQRLEELLSSTDDIWQQAKTGSVIREGLEAVIVGEPNTGKSSLLNALAGDDIAIVNQQAGTTRDILKETIDLEGLSMRLLDTAGLRISADEIEQEGIRRIKKEAIKVDVILFMRDVSSPNTQLIVEPHIIKSMLERYNITIPDQALLITINNKIDLRGCTPSIEVSGNQAVISLSAKHQQGLDLLVKFLKQHYGIKQNNEGTFVARRRHLIALEKTHAFIVEAKKQLHTNTAGELVAEDLRQAQQVLGEITGEFSADDLLGEIFSSFCIGK
jgi:tRNA modification GTPase